MAFWQPRVQLEVETNLLRLVNSEAQVDPDRTGQSFAKIQQMIDRELRHFCAGWFVAPGRTLDRIAID